MAHHDRATRPNVRKHKAPDTLGSQVCGEERVQVGQRPVEGLLKFVLLYHWKINFAYSVQDHDSWFRRVRKSGEKVLADDDGHDAI